MLTNRAQVILNSIVGQYITRAIPVPSQSLCNEYGLKVSPATIRNEMARLEDEGYITRPHPSAGSIPLDKGYRHYVESLGSPELPSNDQLMIDHLFHQVEGELDKWVRLAATLISQLVRNMALVTTPKPAHCEFRHLEVVALQDSMALVVAIFHGARVRQQLIVFDRSVSQATLTVAANRFNAVYANLTRPQISARNIELSAVEKQINECLLKIMQEEDEQEYEEPYLEGFHFILNQPEFAHSQQMLSLVELVEQRRLLSTILSTVTPSPGIQVVIGRENKAEAIQNCSVVISRYGPPQEAMGAIGVIGPTRMSYARVISTVGYISSVLNELVAELYSKDNSAN